MSRPQAQHKLQWLLFFCFFGSGLAPTLFATEQPKPRVCLLSQVILVSGANQTSAVSTTLPNPIVVQALSLDGTVIESNTTISFSVVSPTGATGASFSNPNPTTASDGTASTLFTPGNLPGSYQITASARCVLPANAATFNETALPGTPTLTLAKAGGDNQTATVPNIGFALPMAVQVTPPASVPITFTISQAPSNSTQASLSATSAGGTTTTSLPVQTDPTTGLASVYLLPDVAGQYQVSAFCTAATSICINSPVMFTETYCPLNVTQDAARKTMIAHFTPSAGSLVAAEKACGFVGFNWQQKITSFTPPDPKTIVPRNPALIPQNISSDGSFFAPPAVFDPPPGSWIYFDSDYNPYPFYYPSSDVISQEQSPTNKCVATLSNCPSSLYMVSQDDTTLAFYDSPSDQCLPNPPGTGTVLNAVHQVNLWRNHCAGEAPQGSDVEFLTMLVGINQDGTASSPLSQWTWKSTFNGTAGGIAVTSSNLPIDPGSGTGGVTITGLNGVPQTPPTINCNANPNTLSPDGQSVSVAISGSVLAGTSTILPGTLLFSVDDSEGQIEPSGPIALNSDGTYSFTVPVIASDAGREYTVQITTSDNVGNVGSCSALVSIPNPLGVPSSGNTCNGTFTGTFNGNLNISTAQTCVFEGGSITGNITQTGGDLLLNNTAVGGNLHVMGGGTFLILPSTTIDGDLQVNNLPASPSENQVCGATINGNLQYQNNAASIAVGGDPSCPGTTVGGNVQIQNNTASATVSTTHVTGDLQDQNNSAPTQLVANTVGGNLQVQNNAGSTQIVNNSVQKNLECNNNASITGGGNTASQKQGQCANF